jgi:hypothetical protein
MTRTASKIASAAYPVPRVAKIASLIPAIVSAVAWGREGEQFDPGGMAEMQT